MLSLRCSPFLSEELLWEILSFLPVKALMRFKCVCKSWNFLVYNPFFVKLQLQRSSTNTSITCTLHHLDNNYELFLHCCSKERLLEDPSSIAHDGGFPFKSKYYVIGVCNGLVCLRTKTVEGGFEKFWVRFWNPATRLRSKKLCIQSHRFFEIINLSMGFGYDDSRDTYKVVAVIVNEKSLETEVRVQCLGDNCWRKVASWSGFPKLKEANGEHANGTLNWIAQVDSTSRTVTHNQNLIYSFDLRNETYRYLLLPNGLDLVEHLGALKNCLCLLQCNNGTHFSVWQMKEYGMVESWTLLLNVTCHRLQIFNYFYCQFPLCMSENGDFLLLAGFEVIMCNQRDNIVKQIQIDTNMYYFNFFDYVQTLVLPY